MKYILDKDRKPQPCPNLDAWAAWFEKADRIVLLDKLPTGTVSTVFLGLDHSLPNTGHPILWETRVFGGKLDGEQRRFSSEAAAIACHKELVEQVRKAG